MNEEEKEGSHVAELRKRRISDCSLQLSSHSPWWRGGGCRSTDPDVGSSQTCMVPVGLLSSSAPWGSQRSVPLSVPLRRSNASCVREKKKSHVKGWDSMSPPSQV